MTGKQRKPGKNINALIKITNQQSSKYKHSLTFGPAYVATAIQCTCTDLEIISRCTTRGYPNHSPKLHGNTFRQRVPDGCRGDCDNARETSLRDKQLMYIMHETHHVWQCYVQVYLAKQTDDFLTTVHSKTANYSTMHICLFTCLFYTVFYL